MRTSSTLLIALLGCALLVGVAVWWGLRADEASSVEKPGTAPVAVPLAPSESSAPEVRRDIAPGPVVSEAVPRATDVEVEAASNAINGAAPEAERSRVFGRVFAPNGAPLAGARVLAASRAKSGPWPLDSLLSSGKEAPLEALSNAEGRFEILGLDVGAVRAAVRADGCAPLDLASLWLPAGEGLDLGDLRMAAAVSLSGRVVDDRRVGVAGARLYALDHSLLGPVELLGEAVGLPLAVSDRDGRFACARIGPGAWRILVRADEHPEAVFEILAPADGLPITDLELALEPGATIEGRVVGPYPNELIGLRVAGLSAEVSDPDDSEGVPVDSSLASNSSLATRSLASYRETAVGELGDFVLAGLAVDQEYRLRVLVPGEKFETLDAWSLEVDVLSGARDVELDFEPGATILFQVVERPSGEPVEDFTFRLIGLTSQSMLDKHDEPIAHHPGGRVRMSGLRALRDDGPARPPAEQESAQIGLSIEARGYDFTHVAGLEIATRQVLDVGTIQLDPLPVLRVRVTDAQTQVPIRGAMVTLSTERTLFGRRSRSEATSDGKGLARLTTLAVPTGVVRVVAAGYLMAAHYAPAVVHAADPPLEVALIHGASVDVRVVDRDGSAVADAVVLRLSEVEAFEPADDVAPQSLSVDLRGRARFTSLLPGIQSFAAVRRTRFGTHLPVDKEKLDWSSVGVAPGEERELVLTTPELCTFEGVVLRGGEPLARARLRLAPGRGVFDRAYDHDNPLFVEVPAELTDAQGRFAWKSLAEGQYQLSIEHGESGLSTWRSVRVRPRDGEQTIEVLDTGVRGRVIDETGTPVAGAEVAVYVNRRGRRTDVFVRPGAMFSTAKTARTVLTRTQTNANGEYGLFGVVPDTWLDISARLGSRSSVRSNVRAPTSKIIDGVDLTLQRGGDLAVHLDAPLPHFTLRLAARAVCVSSPEDIDVIELWFDDHGRAQARDLARGRWSVMPCSVDKTGRIVEVGQRAVAEIKSGESTELELSWL